MLLGGTSAWTSGAVLSNKGDWRFQCTGCDGTSKPAGLSLANTGWLGIGRPLQATASRGASTYTTPPQYPFIDWPIELREASALAPHAHRSASSKGTSRLRLLQGIDTRTPPVTAQPYCRSHSPRPRTFSYRNRAPRGLLVRSGRDTGFPIALLGHVSPHHVRA